MKPFQLLRVEMRSPIVLRQKLKLREAKCFRDGAQELGYLLLDCAVLLPSFPLLRQIPASLSGKC